MSHAYEIGASEEMDRLKLVFEDAAFGVRAMQGVNRVGGRRDASGKTTHYVFPPEVRGDVEAAIAKAVAREEAQRVWEAAAPQREAEAKAAQKRAKAEAKAAADAAVTAEIGKWTQDGAVCFLRIEYAKGAPLKLRAAGASWDSIGSVWVFPFSARPAVEKLLPKLKDLAMKQRKRDAQSARGLLDLSDDMLEQMANDGVLGNDINASGADLRREIRACRI
jgi:hypothetical protein